MYIVFSTNKIKAEHLDEFLAQVRVHAANSNAEPGCVRYDVMQDTTDPQTVCLQEVFLNEDAFHAHQANDFYKDWMARSKDWRHAEYRVRHVLDYVFRSEDG
ncbi:MAG: putative quinol monooxygenase [Chloroflexi bacterium]|nr:putative quinol monooxygenase [Chloroflexota bacterium]